VLQQVWQTLNRQFSVLLVLGQSVVIVWIAVGQPRCARQNIVPVQQSEISSPTPTKTRSKSHHRPRTSPRLASSLNTKLSSLETYKPPSWAAPLELRPHRRGGALDHFCQHQRAMRDLARRVDVGLALTFLHDHRLGMGIPNWGVV
jgi:hypothetical protein